jgi:hypothetical protein
METILLVLISFILPFLVFLLFPLWKNNKGEAGFYLVMISTYLWGVALFAIMFYGLIKFVFKIQDFSYYKSYLFGLALGILILIFWVLIKKSLKVK